jgi:hypothetical protein
MNSQAHDKKIRSIFFLKEERDKLEEEAERYGMEKGWLETGRFPFTGYSQSAHS